jgi:hypothetical protein
MTNMSRAVTAKNLTASRNTVNVIKQGSNAVKIASAKNAKIFSWKKMDMSQRKGSVEILLKNNGEW